MHPLQFVFDEVISQVENCKGNERHGNGAEFMAQPWNRLAKTYGSGFLVGQAAKKLEEAMGMECQRQRAELLGAMAYLAMFLLFTKGK